MGMQGSVVTRRESRQSGVWGFVAVLLVDRFLHIFSPHVDSSHLFSFSTEMENSPFL